MPFGTQRIARPLCTSSPMKDIPKLYSLSLSEIDEVLILEIVESVSSKREFVITPLSILGVSGFPIADQTEVLKNKPKIKKIKNILASLKTQGIVRQRKSKQDYKGIKETAYELIIKNNENKSLEELENDHWEEPKEFPTGMVKNCYEYRKIKLDDLKIEQIRLLISQQIGLEYLTELALEKLEWNILAEGDLYEGDLLEAVSKLPPKFWSEKRILFQKLKRLVERNSEKVINEIGEKHYGRIAERIKACAQQKR